MRPKLLEIEGLQSFTQAQKIDFELLGETGLFGIFGPTGSGKSTILDAITFALYGKVKRAESGTQGIVNSNLKIARVEFTFELLMDGSRKTYRVERAYQRKSNSANSCEPKVVRLIEVTDAGEIPLLDKATEVSNYIRDLLGLNHEDFTRAVVLPQNSFQEFLLLNNKDRKGMLERIFYLEEYGKKLSDKLTVKIAGLKSTIDSLTGELKGYQDASDEALEEARKTMKEAIEQRDKVSKKLKNMQGKFEEAKEVWSLVEELRDFNEKEERHTAVKHLIEEKRQRLEKAQRAEGILDIINKNKELEVKLAETEKQLDAIVTKLPDIEAALFDKRAKNEAFKGEIAVESPKLLELKTRLADAFSVKSELEATKNKMCELSDSIKDLAAKADAKKEVLDKETIEFQQIGKSIKELEAECETIKINPEYRQQIQRGVALENEVMALKGNVKEFESKLKPLKDAVQDFQENLVSIRSEISLSLKEQEKITAELQRNGQSSQEERNVILKDMETIHNISGVNEVLKLRTSELEELLMKLSEQKKDIEQAEQKRDELIRIRDDVNKEYEICVLENEIVLRRLEENSAYTLSKKLKDGEPCPVCGSMHHPEPAFNIHVEDMALLDSQGQKAKKKLEEAAAALKSAEGNILILSEQLKIKQHQYRQTLQDIEQKKAQYESDSKRLPERLRSLGTEQIKQEIEAARKANDVKLKEIENREAAQEKHKNNLDSLKEIIAKHRVEENGIASELKVTLENVVQIENDLNDAQKALEEAQNKNTEFLQEHGISGAQDELHRLSENDRRLDLLQKRIRNKQEEEGIKREILDKLKEELQELSSEIIKLRAEAEGLEKHNDDRKNKLRELVGDADIADETAKVDQRLKAYASREKEYQQELELLEKTYNELKTEKSLLVNQRSIYSDDLGGERSLLAAALENKGFEHPDDVLKSSMTRDEQNILKAEIEEYDRILVNIQAQKILVKKKLKSRTISKEEWNNLSSEFTELTAYNQSCISQCMVAERRFEDLDKKHERWMELSRSFGEINHKKGLFEQIYKLLKAEPRKDNSFIDYIAHERLRYVAAKASELLGVMTKYRYALELDAEEGFIVRDDANGGAYRMVKSLSGGETFLASFSLALALSEQIQLKGQSPLEFFFLDEGFGTLDSELLNNVIDALERLSSKERIIGLISHVPELKGRISRRLVVTPPTLQGEGSKVKIEKA